MPIDAIKEHAADIFLDVTGQVWKDEDGNEWEYTRHDALSATLRFKPASGGGPRYFQIKVSESV